MGKEGPAVLLCRRYYSLLPCPVFVECFGWRGLQTMTPGSVGLLGCHLLGCYSSPQGWSFHTAMGAQLFPSTLHCPCSECRAQCVCHSNLHALWTDCIRFPVHSTDRWPDAEDIPSSDKDNKWAWFNITIKILHYYKICTGQALCRYLMSINLIFFNLQTTLACHLKPVKMHFKALHLDRIKY